MKKLSIMFGVLVISTSFVFLGFAKPSEDLQNRLRQLLTKSLVEINTDDKQVQAVQRISGLKTIGGGIREARTLALRSNNKKKLKKYSNETRGRTEIKYLFGEKVIRSSKERQAWNKVYKR